MAGENMAGFRFHLRFKTVFVRGRAHDTGDVFKRRPRNCYCLFNTYCVKLRTVQKRFRGAFAVSMRAIHPSAARSYLVLWHDGEGFDDGGQRHLALFGQLGGAGEGVGGAAHEPGAGVT